MGFVDAMLFPGTIQPQNLAITLKEKPINPSLLDFLGLGDKQDLLQEREKKIEAIRQTIRQILEQGERTKNIDAAAQLTQQIYKKASDLGIEGGLLEEIEELKKMFDALREQPEEK